MLGMAIKPRGGPLQHPLGDIFGEALEGAETRAYRDPQIGQCGVSRFPFR